MMKKLRNFKTSLSKANDNELTIIMKLLIIKLLIVEIQDYKKSIRIYLSI